MVLRGRCMRSWLWAIVLCLTGCGYQLAKLTPTRIDTQDTQLLSTWRHSFQSNTDASNAIVVRNVKFVRHELFGATSEVLLSLEAQVRYPNGITQHFVATERYPYQKTAAPTMSLSLHGQDFMKHLPIKSPKAMPQTKRPIPNADVIFTSTPSP